MKAWERPPLPPPDYPPKAEIFAVLREADADMPAHIEDFTDQRAYLVGAVMARWPGMTAACALAFVREWGR